MVGKVLLGAFLLPGELMCNAVGASEGEDRTMIRTLVNVLAWNLVGVFAVVVLW